MTPVIFLHITDYLSALPAEGKYTIYAVSADNKAGILAESHTFEAKGSASPKPVSGVSDGLSEKGSTTASGTSDTTKKATDGKKTSGASTIGMSLAVLGAAAMCFTLF